VNLLLEASLRFPTVIFTIGLGIALIYWLFVLLGALDIDLLGGSDASGAIKGAGDVLTGGAKGGAEAIKGLHLGDGADGADVGHGHDADGGAADGGFWHALGLATVPVTISISVIMLVCWVASLLGMRYGGAAVGNLAGWLPAIMLLAVLIVGIPPAGVLVRPPGPGFEIQPGKSTHDYLRDHRPPHEQRL